MTKAPVVKGVEQAYTLPDIAALVENVRFSVDRFNVVNGGYDAELRFLEALYGTLISAVDKPHLLIEADLRKELHALEHAIRDVPIMFPVPRGLPDSIRSWINLERQEAEAAKNRAFQVTATSTILEAAVNSRKEYISQPTLRPVADQSYFQSLLSSAVRRPKQLVAGISVLAGVALLVYASSTYSRVQSEPAIFAGSGSSAPTAMRSLPQRPALSTPVPATPVVSKAKIQIAPMARQFASPEAGYRLAAINVDEPDFKQSYLDYLVSTDPVLKRSPIKAIVLDVPEKSEGLEKLLFATFLDNGNTPEDAKRLVKKAINYSGDFHLEVSGETFNGDNGFVLQVRERAFKLPYGKFVLTARTGAYFVKDINDGLGIDGFGVVGRRELVEGKISLELVKILWSARDYHRIIMAELGIDSEVTKSINRIDEAAISPNNMNLLKVAAGFLSASTSLWEYSGTDFENGVIKSQLGMFGKLIKSIADYSSNGTTEYRIVLNTIDKPFDIKIATK